MLCVSSSLSLQSWRLLKLPSLFFSHWERDCCWYCSLQDQLFFGQPTVPCSLSPDFKLANSSQVPWREDVAAAAAVGRRRKVLNQNRLETYLPNRIKLFHTFACTTRQPLPGFKRGVAAAAASCPRPSRSEGTAKLDSVRSSKSVS